MRALSLIAASLCAACASGLSQGDRAFANGEWRQAQVAWNTVDGHDDEVALRLALLHATPESALYDEARAVEVMSLVRAQWPRTVAGIVADQWLDAVEQRRRTQAHVTELQAALTAGLEALRREEELAADDRAEATLELEQSEERRQRLQAELERLRAELQALQTETDTLREELEALKSIDLRR